MVVEVMGLSFRFFRGRTVDNVFKFLLMKMFVFFYGFEVREFVIVFGLLD